MVRRSGSTPTWARLTPYSQPTTPCRIPSGICNPCWGTPRLGGHSIGVWDPEEGRSRPPSCPALTGHREGREHSVNGSPLGTWCWGAAGPTPLPPGEPPRAYPEEAPQQGQRRPCLSLVGHWTQLQVGSRGIDPGEGQPVLGGVATTAGHTVGLSLHLNPG